MEKRPTDKEAFFEELYDLDNESTESEDNSEVAVLLQKTRTKPITSITPIRSLNLSSNAKSPAARTLSSPLLAPTPMLDPDITTTVKDNPTLPKSSSFGSSRVQILLSTPPKLAKVGQNQ